MERREIEIDRKRGGRRINTSDKLFRMGERKEKLKIKMAVIASEIQGS